MVIDSPPGRRHNVPLWVYGCHCRILLCFIWISGYCGAQDHPADSIGLLSEVAVTAFSQPQNLSTAAITRVTPIGSSKTSLVADLNAITGVRMEERSPGSYRINIRGSSLRSPFGVRNVKIYWNDLPLTDPGGGSYFNQLAFNNFSRIDIYKGPASSMYGAGTGGLVLIQSEPSRQTGAALEYAGGSYGLQQLLFTGDAACKNGASRLSYAHQQTEGYRDHSAMRKDNISWINTLTFSQSQQINLSLLYTDMYYQTPGALTYQEYISNPRAARPAAGRFSSAAEARAAIFQKNITGGLTYRYRFNQEWRQRTTLYGAYNQIRNPAVRNYETRSEPHYGGSTVFTMNQAIGTGDSLIWSSGAELQRGHYKIQVNGNNAGTPDTLQTNDRVKSLVYSVFTQASIATRKGWTYTAGISYNRSSIGFTRLSDQPVRKQPFVFSSELAPRFSISRNWKKEFILLATVAKGYAPPAIAELLPSTGMINTGLEAEKGWNYELTARKNLWGNLQLDATAYYFDLKNALVQRRDETGADYFANAGNIHQAGAEFSGGYIFHPRWLPALRWGYFRMGYTYSHFRYGLYVNESGDYSSNTVPGVPARALSTSLNLELKNGFYGDLNYYSAAEIFLDEANSVQAPAYHLAGLKLGYRTRLDRWQLDLYLGGANLLDETYSLGNDINAAGGRYYNAAPGRNYFAGAALSWHK